MLYLNDTYLMISKLLITECHVIIYTTSMANIVEVSAKRKSNTFFQMNSNSQFNQEMGKWHPKNCSRISVSDSKEYPTRSIIIFQRVGFREGECDGSWPR